MTLPTYHGIHKWYVKMAEKFGWMVVSKAESKKQDVSAKRRSHLKKKLKMYVEGLEVLHMSIIEKMEMVEEKDRMHDLHIIKTHVEQLHSAAKKMFK